jgi:hypothetical protein
VSQWRNHLKTIHHHRSLVRKYCFRVGLYWQGLTHDLSKYSPTEFLVGAVYFQGNRSPNDAERADKGYSSAWLHHKGRNKHHLEYWIDYGVGGDHKMCGMKMPVRYVAEMICDRIAASRTYRKELYQDGDPYEYYDRSRDHYILHSQTREMLERYLKMLKDEGEEKTLRCLREEVKKDREQKGRKAKQ